MHFLELYDGETLPAELPGCGRTLLPFSDERVMNRVLEFGNPGGTPVPLRLLKLCAHPAAALAAVRQIAFKKPRRISAAKKAIEALDARCHFDAAVAVAAPYAGSFALAAARFGGKKASWQMDPYAANRQLQRSRRLRPGKTAAGSAGRGVHCPGHETVLCPRRTAGAFCRQGPCAGFSQSGAPARRACRYRAKAAGCGVYSWAVCIPSCAPPIMRWSCFAH